MAGVTSASWARTTLLGLACVACGPSIREPEVAEGPAPESAFETVPYPPPHAVAELVPESPDRRAVWVDGHYAYRPTGYFWVPGGWVIPPKKGHYFHSRFRYEPDGTMLFAPSGWYDDQGRRLPNPPVLLPADTPPNEFTEDER